MCEEIWKDVVNYEALYQVSNLGGFRRHPIAAYKTQDLNRATSINRLGYVIVNLSKNGKKGNRTLHQLVFAAFTPTFKYGQVLNHKDGDKTNNCLDNLELTNSSLNNIHAYQTGLKKIPKKVSNYFGVSFLNRTYKRKDGTIVTIPTYFAKVRINGKKIAIKQSTDEILCAKAYDAYLDSIGDTVHKRNFS